MKRTLSSIAAAALVLGTLAPAAFADTAGSYSDVTTGGYGSTAINDLTAKSFIHGFSDGTYKPGYIVSRGQLLAYMMNALGLKAQANAQYYADVAPGNWAFNYVGAAQENGWINPYWIGVKPGYNFNENNQASMGDAASFFVAAMENSGKISKTDLNGMSPLAYAKSIGLFNGVDATQNTLATYTGGTDTVAQQSVYLNRASAAIVLENIVAWNNGQLLPAGVTLTVSGGASVAPGSSEVLTVVAKNADGSTYTLPSTAVINWAVDNKNGFFNPNSPGQLVVAQNGAYNVTATVDGVATAPYTVTAFGAAAGLKVTAAKPSIPANGNSTDVVTVQVVDANGNPVNNYNGTVVVTDTNSLLWNSTTSAYTNNLGAVTVTNGQATFNVKSGVAIGLTDTITATTLTSNGLVLNTAAGTAVSQTATVSTVPQVATTMSISAAQPVVQDNVVTNDAVSAQVLDQDGQPMLTGTYPITFSVSGQGQIDGGTANVTGVYVGNGSVASPATVSVNAQSEQGVTGSMTITAASTGLSAVSTSIKSVVVGTANAVQLTGSTFSVASAGTTTLQAAVVDMNGYPTSLPAGDALSVAVTQNGSASTGLTASLNSATDVVTVTGVASGSYTVTLTDTLGLLKSAAQTITVGSGSATQVSLSTGSVYVPDYNASTTVSAQLSDVNGNSVAQAGTPVTFTFTSASGQTATFNGVSIVTGNSVVVDTNAQGIAAASFTAPPNAQAGTFWTVKAVIANQTVAAASENIIEEFSTASTVTVALQDTGAQNSAFSGNTVDAQGGDTVTGTVYVKDQYGAPVITPDNISLTLPSNMVAVSGLNGSASPYTMTVIGGKATFTAIVTSDGAATVTAADTSVAPTVSGSSSMTIIPGNASGAALYQNGTVVSAPVAVTANTPVLFTVESVDGGSNPVVASYPETVNLYDGGAGGQFRLSTTGASVSSVTIPAGQSSVVVYYVNGSSSTGTGDTFSAKAAATVTVSSSQSIVANNVVDAVYATATDSNGIQLAGSTVYFTVSGGGTLSAISATMDSTGKATVNYTAPATGSGSATVTATTYKGNVPVSNTTTIQY